MISDVAHLSTCLWAICVSSVGKCQLRSPPPRPVPFSREKSSAVGALRPSQGPTPCGFCLPWPPCLDVPGSGLSPGACPYRRQLSRREAQGEVLSQEESVDSKCYPGTGALERKGTRVRCLLPRDPALHPTAPHSHLSAILFLRPHTPGTVRAAPPTHVSVTPNQKRRTHQEAIMQKAKSRAGAYRLELPSPTGLAGPVGLRASLHLFVPWLRTQARSVHWP